MNQPRAEFVKFEENGKSEKTEEQKLLLAIKSLDFRYRVLISVMYMMIFLLIFIIYRLYQIFQIIG